MNQSNQNLFALVARVLLAALFIVAGLNKMMNFQATAGVMASAGVPITTVLLVATIVLELFAGTMILIGYHARLAAVMLVLFLIPVTLIFHNPLTATDPAMAQQQMNHLLKNIAIIGGLLHVMAFGSGTWSLRPEQDLPMQTL